MPLPVDEPTADDPFVVKPESHEYEALSFLVAHHEYGFTPHEIAAQTDLSKSAASKTMTRLVESGLVERAERVYYIAPHRVDELTQRLESLDAAVTLFEATPDDDAYAEDGWEQDVPSIDPSAQTERPDKRESEALKARAETLVTELENDDPEQ